jgi:hypothetical protein
LAPRFLHFEDPEYNRRLASAAAQAGAALTLGTVAYTATFATDRREYNPDSAIAWRYDWAGAAPTPEQSAKLTVRRVRAEDPEPVRLLLDKEAATPEPSKLYQRSLLDLQIPSEGEDPIPASLRPGDALLFQLVIGEGKESATASLTVQIVANPVIPVPEAAYALLRWQGTEDDPTVECVRFAWSPQPSRVELVCAQDLRTGVVRRRAVYQWRDSARPGTLIGDGYAVQKITQSGSTHVPKGPQAESG